MGLLGCAGKADLDPAEAILGQYAAYGEITCVGKLSGEDPVGLVDNGYLTGEQCNTLNLSLNPRNVIVSGGNKGLLTLDDSEKETLQGLGVQRTVLEKIAGVDGKETLNRHVRQFSSVVTDWCLTSGCKRLRYDAVGELGRYAPHASEEARSEAVDAIINFVNENKEALQPDGGAYRRWDALHALAAIGTEPARSAIIKEMLRKDKGRFVPGTDFFDHMTLTPDTIELAFDTAHAGNDNDYNVADAKFTAAQLIFKSFMKLSDEQKERALRLFDAKMKDNSVPQCGFITSMGAHIADDDRIFDRFMRLVEDKIGQSSGLFAFDAVLNCVLTRKREGLYPKVYQYIEELGAERYTRQLGGHPTDEAVEILKRLLWNDKKTWSRAAVLDALSEAAGRGQMERLLDLVPHLENFIRYGDSQVQVSANSLLSKLITTPWWNEFMPWDKVMRTIYK